MLRVNAHAEAARYPDSRLEAKNPTPHPRRDPTAYWSELNELEMPKPEMFEPWHQDPATTTLVRSTPLLLLVTRVAPVGSLKTSAVVPPPEVAPTKTAYMSRCSAP